MKEENLMKFFLAVCKADHLQLTIGYKQMRDLLERLCRLHMHNGSLQMTDLSARISFVAAKVRAFCSGAKQTAYLPTDLQCHSEPTTGTYPRTPSAGCENAGFLHP